MRKAKEILNDNYLSNKIIILMEKANKAIMKIYHNNFKQIQTKK